MFRVLDLYCREGGAGMGFIQAGATEVVGHDTEDKAKRYPGKFVRGSALDLSVEYIRTFDYVHASPPCQFGTALRHAPNAKGASGNLNLIPATRELLRAAGVPYDIENVPDVARAGHLIEPVMLNGFMFGLGCTTSDGVRFHLDRERYFEASWPLKPPTAWTRKTPIVGVYGAHIRNRAAGHGGRGTVDFPGENKPALAKEAMGMPWATMDGMSEAIPPAFTRCIGEQFLAWRESQREAA